MENTRPILLLTNRRFDGDAENAASSARTDSALFNNKFNRKRDEELRVATAEFQDGRFHVDVLCEGDEGDRAEWESVTKMRELLSDKRDIIFFMHGFFQSLEDNLKKAQSIKERYDVNVIVFSWPSFPTLLWLIPLALSLLVVHWIVAAAAPNFYSLAVGITPPSFNGVNVCSSICGFVAFFITVAFIDYHRTRKKAQRSAKAFCRSLAQIKKQRLAIAEKTQQENKMSLLVHSLGNHVFETMLNTLQGGEHLPIFNEVMCHQADVHASDSHAWVKELTTYSKMQAEEGTEKGEKTNKISGEGEEAPAHYRVHITNNAKDWVLRFSCYANLKPRLGHSGFAMGLPNVHYKDFSSMKKDESCHEIFHQPAALSNAGVREYFDDVFLGKKASA